MDKSDDDVVALSADRGLPRAPAPHHPLTFPHCSCLLTSPTHSPHAPRNTHHSCNECENQNLLGIVG